MKYYVVDAFADKLFAGNPAGVCILNHAIEDELMQKIAAENNLAETAFVLPMGDGYSLRWFTPTVEVDLCGHATLASGFIVSSFVSPNASVVHFDTASGPLTVTRNGDLFEMDFPSRNPAPVEVTKDMADATGAKVIEAFKSRDLILMLEDERTVGELEPDMELIAKLCDFGVVVTAPGNRDDFVSRFFGPNVGVPEDPVTGSAHSSLIPLWAGRLGKSELVARQLSKRGGTVYCADRGERVEISGRAILYLEGEIRL